MEEKDLKNTLSLSANRSYSELQRMKSDKVTYKPPQRRIKPRKAASITLRSQTTPNSTLYISLSEAIKKYPSTFDQSKISLVDKCIGNIDLLPTPLQKIEILYLSGNFISDLQHITQFKYLKTLSLTNNELDNIETLYPLKSLINLRNITLNGNPFAKRIQNSRLHIISYLRHIETLDSKLITPEERKSAYLSIQKQNQLYEMIAHSIAEFYMYQKIHAKLNTGVKIGKIFPQFNANFDAELIFGEKELELEGVKEFYMIDREEFIRQAEDMVSDLSNRMPKRGDIDWDIPFTEVLVKINSQIAEIKAIIVEQMKKSNEKVIRFGRPLQDPQDLNASFPQPLSLSPGQKNIIKNKLSKSQRLDIGPKTAPGRKAHHKLTFSQEIEGGRNKMSESPRSQAPRPIEKNSTPTSMSTTYTNILNKRNPLRNTIPDTTSSRILRSVHSPPKKCHRFPKSPPEFEGSKPNTTTSTLRHRDSMSLILQDELIEKLDEITKVKKFNQQLKGKLTEFQTQNELNVNKAEETISKLSIKLDLATKANKTLEFQLLEATERMHGLSVDKGKLDIVTENSNILNEQVKGLENQLFLGGLKKDNHKIARDYRTYAVVRNVFKLFQTACRYQKIVRVLCDNRRERLRAKTTEIAFEALKKYTLIEKLIQHKIRLHTARFVKLFMWRWRKYNNRVQGIFYINKRHEIGALKRGLRGLRHYITYKEIASQHRQVADNVYYSNLVSKVISGLKYNAGLLKLTPLEQETYRQKADNFKEGYMKCICFLKWRQLFVTEILPKRDKNIKAYNHYAGKLLSRVMDYWKYYMITWRKIERRACLFEKRGADEIMQESFKKLMVYLIHKRKMKRLQLVSRHIKLKRRFRMWKRAKLAMNEYKTKYYAAILLNNELILRRYFNVLRSMRDVKKKEHLLETALRTKTNHKIVKRIFYTWIRTYFNKRNANKRRDTERKGKIRFFFEKWQEYLTISRIKKINLRKAQKLRIKLFARHIRKILMAWSDHSWTENKRELLLTHMRAKGEYKLLRGTFSSWLRYVNGELMDKVSEHMSARNILTSNYEEQEMRMSIAEQEYNKVSAMVEELKDQKLDLVKEIKTKQITMERLDISNKGLEVQANTAQDSAKKEYERSIELEDALKNRDRDCVDQKKKFEKNISQLSKMNEKLSKKTQSLEKDLKLRHETMIKAEKELLGARSKEQSSNQDTLKKLETVVRANTEFKNLLEGKLSEQTQLMRKLRRTEEERDNLRRKMDESYDTTESINLVKEERIQHLSSESSIQKQEIISLQERLNQRNKQINDLKRELREEQHEKLSYDNTRTPSSNLNKSSERIYQDLPQRSITPRSITPREIPDIQKEYDRKIQELRSSAFPLSAPINPPEVRVQAPLPPRSRSPMFSGITRILEEDTQTNTEENSVIEESMSLVSAQFPEREHQDPNKTFETRHTEALRVEIQDRLNKLEQDFFSLQGEVGVDGDWTEDTNN